MDVSEYIVLGILVAVPCIYVLSWVAARAYFRAKLRYQSELFKNLKKETETDGEEEETCR